ncbi:MAG: LpqB family beta-propeller domain-containing protein [Steroidobacteraceae bacterium]
MTCTDLARRFPRWRTAIAGAIAVLATALPATAGEGAWNVEDTGQPYQDVAFEVTEGTWMSVDVSPDGGTLVFDLLGDIYSLPATGGEARLVHGGAAMQRAPRFSPDGRSLLYLSDASGADNVWVSGVDGSGARQLTHETVDLLMGPTWGADGTSFAAARTQASFPGMKSSEVRWYELGGGEGRLLVETPQNHRDVQEARFSPDGRYLYYTQRLTDPNIYVDGNHINYAIMRRDLATGATEQLLSGFGSATTPQVSPDGRRVAFVRRVMQKTVLFVLDLETRRQRPVYDALDRDEQTDFVPQGAYYPGFAWFPDNRRIAIWARGHLHAIDADGGSDTEIPFRAPVHQRVTPPLRVPHPLDPDRFTVRAVRQLAPAPDGRTLVFTALGHLWRKALPDGAPARLTRAAAFEYEPAYSPDGRHLAYVEWDDERGSALRVADADGRHARVIATSPGVIRQPAFAPDGGRVVYRIQPGDKSMGGFRARAGIYWIAAAGGEPHYVGAGDDAPGFSPDGRRIYYTRIDYPGDGVVHRLESVTPEGLDRRVHAQTPDADTRELRPSPDLRWIAFRERQQYYVLPYRETGTPLTVSVANGAVPVARLTTLGGYALAWSADSATLHWALGPALYRAGVAGLFASGGTPPASYANVGLEVPVDRPTGALALLHGRVITMRGEEVIDDGAVIVQGNRITAVGPVAGTPVPAGARIVDVSGKTLMPGLVDMHGHIDCCYETGVTPQKQPTRGARLRHHDFT